MKTCDTCKNYKLLFFPCEGCHNNDGWEPKPHSNADRIRAMSDEELSVLLEGCICPKDPCPDIDRDTPTDKKRCTECWLDWLRQEAEDNEL